MVLNFFILIKVSQSPFSKVHLTAGCYEVLKNHWKYFHANPFASSREYPGGCCSNTFVNLFVHLQKGWDKNFFKA